jgi:hypothetical protein
MENLDGSLLGTAIIKVLQVDNKYQSYSQYIEAFDPNFDYHIFTEDDYVPVTDDFDQILIDEFDQAHENQRCGYLCGGAWACPATNSPWAAISWGISSNKVLADVDFTLDQLNPDLCQTDYKVAHYAKFQFLFSNIFLNGKYSICDIRHRYKSCFYRFAGNNPGPDLNNSHFYVGVEDASEIIAPIQMQQSNGLFPESFVNRIKDHRLLLS